MSETIAGLWRHPPFLRLWAADALMELGRQTSIVVVPLIGALTLGASPFQMGVLGASATAPSLLISLIAGVWVDRLPRRAMMIAAGVGRFALVGSVPVLWYADLLSVWLLAGISFLVGTLTLFFDLSRLSWLPSLVGRSQLVEANGKMQASTSVAQMAGPSLGGGVAGIAAPPLAMLIDAPASLVAALFTSRVVGEDRPGDNLQTRQPVWRQAIQGVSIAFGNRLLRATIGASGVVSLFGHVFIAVYVLYMANDLGLSSFAIGLVFAIGGVGGLIGAFLAAPLARRFGVGRTIIGGWLMFGLGGLPIPLAILVPEYALPLVLFSEFIQWMVLEIAEVNQLSLRQAITPDHYLGRVSATYRFTVGGLVPIGSLLGGVLGTLVGVQMTLLIGVAGMLIAFVWVLVSPVRGVFEQPSEPVELVPSPGD
jgi:MFS family permease